MSIIAIVSQKGGSGKTTLTLHLATIGAHEGRKSCVIDTDPQATAAAWGDWRGGDYLPLIVTCPPTRLARTVEKAVETGCDMVVIDTPPHGEAAARAAVNAADIVLVPSRLRPFDLHALEATAELLATSRKPAFVVLNATPARATRKIEEASKFVENLGLKVCPVHLGERAAFHRSAECGGVALEIEPEGKAAHEVALLWQWICQQDKGA